MNKALSCPLRTSQYFRGTHKLTGDENKLTLSRMRDPYARYYGNKRRGRSLPGRQVLRDYMLAMARQGGGF